MPSAALASATGSEEERIPKQATSSGNSSNSVLSRLSTAEYRRLEPHLESVPMTLGETIYKSKGEIDYIYFPETGVISMVAVGDGDKPIEVGLIGSEGFAGLPFFLGVMYSANEVMVQGGGAAQRIRADQALSEFRRGGGFHDLVLLYAHELFLQTAQVTSCNRHHEVEQRLSRWLLMVRDRIANDTLPLTQEFLSWMLGVRLQAVSKAAGGLQKSGAIRYSRGVVTILNRAQLEQKSCPCYRLMKLRAAGDATQAKSRPPPA